MSIERFFAVNLLMDLPLLAIVARSLNALRWRNLLAATALALLYGALAAARPAPWRTLPCQLLALVPTSLALVGRRRLRRLGEAMLLLAAGGLIASGWAAALQLRSVPQALGACPGLAALLCTRRRVRERWETELILTYSGRTARFPALIDTGNLLREPLSGLPVLIVEARLLGDLPPLSGCRTVRYGGVGGSGALRCFLPEAIWCGSRRMPDAWVALSPSPLPGPCRAIAPCAFANVS